MTVQSIKEQFDKVIKYSQCVPNPKTDKLFETWEKSKEYFYKLFGNKYIYELPDEVVFDLSKKAKQQRINSFLESLRYYYGQESLSDFVKDQEEGFFDNLTVKDYTYNGKIITKGSKLVRAFKYFVGNEGLLTDLQNQASRIIQESKISGKLCLSIHPLDYLSISENNYNWRSCHSLDGEYRAGNISYLLDSTTVVCYLKGADEVKLPNFPADVRWNDKKWRVLLYFSNDKNMIFAGRQYPFDSEAGMDIVRYDLLEAIKFTSPAKKTAWSQWNKIIYPKVKITDDVKVVLDKGFVPVGHNVKTLDNVVFNADGSRQFNDVLRSSCYKPHYIAKYSSGDLCWENSFCLSTNNDTRFDIGAYTPCICCGEEAAMYDADTMMCYDCEAKYGNSDNDVFTYCDCCGCRVARDDLYFVGDDYLCPNCFDNETTRCDCCGERVYNSDIKYIEELNKYVCVWCEDTMNQKEKLTEQQEGKSFYVNSASSDSSFFKIIIDENGDMDFLNQYVSIDLNQANEAIREINYVKPTEEDYIELPF